MWFVHFDESKQNNSFFVYSALVLDSDQWNVAFEGIKVASQKRISAKIY
jgi:hypothetical protein